jgi:hypothetical protein
MRLGLHEIIEMAGKQVRKQQKIDVLRRYDSPALRQLLKMALDPTIKWLLPEGKPPYTPCPYMDQESRFYSEMRRMYLFLEGGNVNLTPLKRETLFIGILESLAPKDAELLLSAKEKKLPRGINVQLVMEAFPGLIDGQESQEIS